MSTDVELASSSLVELTFDRLRSEILRGTLAPGERIVEEQVTRRLGISRGPLREALRQLAEQGLIEHLPRRGVRVATLSDSDVGELFDLRDLLERHAVRQALPLGLPQGRARLDGLRRELTAMQAAAVDHETYLLAEAHRRFHTELVALAQHRQLLIAYDSVLLKLQLSMARNLRVEAEVAAPLDGVRRHVALFEALESDDPAVVISALADHGAMTYLH